MNNNVHELNFSQLECINFIILRKFQNKINKLPGLTLFLNEKSEVFMMTTDRIRRYLKNKVNYFIFAVALKTFSKIADRNMNIYLFQYIIELLENDSKYIKKNTNLFFFLIN